MKNKLKSRAAIKAIAERLKSQDKRIVFTNGCFDILHAGHVEYLSKAKEMGDVLIIGLNSDGSVKRLKGEARPINREKDRARVLSALAFVDYVIIFNEDTPELLVRKLKPDIMVKGGDWKGRQVAGADFVRSCGGRLALVPFVKGYSTTSLVKKISGE